MLDRLPGAGTRWRTVALPVGLWMVGAIALHVLVAVAHQLPPLAGGVDYAAVPAPGLFRGWLSYDSARYLTIAEQGYSYVPGEQSSVGLWPAYPLLVRAVSVVVPSASVAGLLVTWLAGLGAAVLFWTWLGGRVGERGRRVALALLLVWPFAFYLYGTAYAEAFSLCATIGAFVLLERDRPVAAGLVGAVAAASRPAGPAIIVGLVALLLIRRGVVWRESADGDAGRGRRVRVDRRRLHLADYGVLLSVLGFGVWCLYLWRRFGDPFVFATVQEAWDQAPGLRTWLKLDIVDRLRAGEGISEGTMTHGLIIVAFVAAVPAVVRRFGWGYGLYTAVVVAVSLLGTATFLPAGRHMLAAFPVFAWAGDRLAERRRAPIYVVAASAIGLVVFTTMFARGRFVA
ncbi:MAG: hypothetical protein ACRD29_17520 [Acidimicrobiales bacterium]